ncbi:MAG: Sensor protein ZraS [Lentisphaerae bacterium ADurb.Bin242]|nr:MAG: Sensor protein ZraS [Lentisphaerae bacterium ADurb.Bin242]
MSFSNPSTPSAFAPAERKGPYLIKAESEQLKWEVDRCSLLDVLPDLIVVLNDERQILFANRTLLKALHLENDSTILGMRPGELLDCVHAKNDSGGCGTTEFCRVCGAVNSILHTRQFHDNTSRECSIITVSDKAHNFRVWTSPFDCQGCHFTLVVLRDIASEVYRNALERIFFHDLINIVSGLYGLLTIINDNPDNYRENHKLLIGLTEELLEQIDSQKDLLAAEDGSIYVTASPVTSIGIMKFVAGVLGNLPAAGNKNISLEKTSEDTEFKTDPRFLKRILINMGKNALEASGPGDPVVLKSSVAGSKVVFEVHNKGYIQPEVQLQIFNRFFSTKGGGRGLGAYSTKLLAEKYLQGKVYFTSSEENGTSFFLELPLQLEKTDSPA